MEQQEVNTIMGMIIVAAAMLGIIIVFAMVGFDLTPVDDVHLEKVVVVEGYEDAFCSHYKGKSAELNKQCAKLTEKNCKSTTCCVYAMMNGQEGCYAGDEHGPTFRFDGEGKTNNIDYYYYNNKCYGTKCKD